MDTLKPLILESAQLMLIGMGTVFIILIMLIFLINLVSKFLVSLKLEDNLEPSRSSYSRNEKNNSTSDTELIAVISSAISSYKKRHTITE